MTLNDLKTGMIVTCRNGREYTVIRDRVPDTFTSSDLFVRFCENDPSHNRFDEYNNNLTARLNSEFDIVKIEKANHPYAFLNLNYGKHHRVTIWKEEKRKKLTVAEIENLLGYKVEIVSEEE